MENVVMIRSFEQAMDDAGFRAMAADAASCLSLYRAHWHESFLAQDGSALVCRFEAPDSESIRMVSRGDGARDKRVWPGTVHDTAREEPATVVVERCFDEPASMDELQAREDAAGWCLEQHRVTFLRSFFSADRRHMLCLYHAPDVESVRVTQQQAGMPVERIWACSQYTMESFLTG